ncbi:glycopeptide antibiotics resistance protein [Fontibacillus solani]|uniref:Glycopeptide antibiotics resistance protein n=1 Tax=Fontibacillus solani TaxID=1572857 RepID=A0A7W3SX50_9BACL|nr:VanZ family protein [Fontibacillus solani]MBA9087871.1 glycopeptide antibiotics resistance protein [Fontibacillus solani]
MKIIIKNVATLGLIGYTFLLAYWMIWGFGREPRSDYMYNIIPFSTISHFLQMDRLSGAKIINLAGNIGVFVPFGILIPLILKRGLIRSWILFLSGILILETTQLLTRRGSFDVDDFILNSVGFLIGYGLYKAVNYRELPDQLLPIQ